MPSNKMSGYKNRNRPRDRHWRDHRQDSLLGSAPRGLHGRPQQQGLLGGGPHGPAMRGGHRPNPWETGMMPSNRALPATLPRGQAMWGDHAPQPPSLLGIPEMMGGSRGGAGLLGGVPRDPAMMDMNQLARINAREPQMSLNIIDTVLVPGGPGPRYGQYPRKMGPMDRSKMARGRGRDNSRPAAGSSGSNDLRKWLKDKRGITSSRSASRQFGAASSSHAGYRSRGSSSATSNRKGKPESDRGASPAQVTDEKDAKAEEKCPVEALRCHVCNVNQFSSVDSFKQHLKTTEHGEMLSSLYRKNSAVLDLLRQQSKIAAMQQTLAATVDNKEPKKSQCYKCFCKVPGSLQKHIASVEHKLVNNFQIVKCCDVWFSSRPDYEQHKLGFRHLLTKYEEKQQTLSENQEAEKSQEEEEKEDGDSSEAPLEWWGRADRALRHLHRASQSEEPLTAASLSPYSGLSPVGESFVRCRAWLECSACDEKFDPAAADQHCRSNSHYLGVLALLKAKDEKEAAAAQPAAENADGDDGSQNRSNASNSSALEPAHSTTSDDEAQGGSGRGDQEDEQSDAEEYHDHGDDQDDEDERMIYEGLNDEPQLEFDDDEEEMHDAEESNADDGDRTPGRGNATPEELSESAHADGPQRRPAEDEEEDEDDIEQYEYEFVENDSENRHEEKESAHTDTQSAGNKDLEPEPKVSANLKESSSAPPCTKENVESKSNVTDEKTEHQEPEESQTTESQEKKVTEDSDQQPAVGSESEREETQTTRRSGRASRKRPAAAEDSGEEQRAAEPTPKRGRGRGRGRGGRK